MDFSALVAPLSAHEFITDVLGCRAQVLRGSPDRFASLLPWWELNNILRFHRFEEGQLRIARNGVRIDPDTYNPETLTYPERSQLMRHRKLDGVSVQQHLREGATLQIFGIDELYEPVARLSAVIEAKIRERVYVHAFVSWGSTQGYKTHWDDSDGIIVQVHGRKKWHLWEPTRVRPDHRDYGEIPPPHGPPQEFVVRAGDVMHVPKGWWHLVTPDDEASVHLAFSLTARTGHDFLTWALDEFRKDTELCRADLPLRDSQDIVHNRHAGDLREALSNYLTSPGLIPLFLRSYDAAQPARRGFSLHPATDRDPLASDAAIVTWLAPLADIESTSTWTGITAAGQRHDFGPHAQALVAVLRDCQPRSMIELRRLANVPVADTREVVRQFVIAGLAAIPVI